MRALIVVCLAVIGLFAGGLAGVLLGAPPGVGSWVGFLGGVGFGMWLAFATYPKRHRPTPPPTTYQPPSRPWR
jgi:hypothetical protein